MSKERSKLTIDVIGNAKAPVLIVDQASQSIESVRYDAVSKSPFAVERYTMYPGVRAPLSKEYLFYCLRPLMPYIRKVFKIPAAADVRLRDSYYSLVSKKPVELTNIQSVPHFDTSNPVGISMIHYLNEGDFGGTGFFRHKNTSYEYITGERQEQYFQALDSYFNSPGFVSGSYCDEEHPEFEMYKYIEYRANRMVLFNGMMLHSALIGGDDVSECPRTGRLTANVFLDFVEH